MEPSDVVGDRFVIERFAGTGGMGRVYRARDRLTGEPVAIKVLHNRFEQAVQRFDREASTLSALSHPRIVRHVDHGATRDGDPYLAMEWLEGEELSARLARSPLGLHESSRLVALVAETLAAAHAHGVIHRDIKPSNLFLVGGEIERVKIMDFGIARRGLAASEISQSGMLLGTPAYMSPEQARLDKKLDFRTDFFSLGCVLFKCLTGRLPFVGESLVAILAKVMLEPAPRVDAVRPDVPQPLADLVASLLEKDPDQRPESGFAISAKITALGPLTETSGAALAPRPPALTTEERRIVSVVLARNVTHPGLPVSPTTDSEPDLEAATIVEDRAALLALDAAVEPYGGRVTLLADGSAVVAISARGAATDQATRAARCARALRAVSPDAQIALALGRTDGVAEGLGRLIDRAAHLFRLPADGGPESRSIHLDEPSAGLLEAGFEVLTRAGGMRLGEERPFKGATRTLLGKSTPFVGRAREIGTLEAVLDECIGEPIPRVVLVTAPAGMGKSRLRHEFVSSLEARPDVKVWISRGDPMSAGSPFGMLAPLVRRAADIQDGERLELRQAKLVARVKRTYAGDDSSRLAEFLGEIIGTPFPDDASVQLRSARRDPILMGDQMRRAWEDFVAAECASGPLVVVLEDLHWGDLPTVSFVDAALRNVGEMPLLVLALARPEVEELFPRLWSGRGVVLLPLGELSPKAAAKLARAALGDAVDSATLERVVAHAGGNAFFLEEIVRHVARGTGGELPDTVLAMVGARLESLEPEARRVLRAASVFGQVCWRGGVLALLGSGDDETIAGEWLDELALREVVTARADSKFEGEREYVFRHAFVRDAAYGMLTGADLELGHELAGEWLERVGERDAMVLAEHFLRGRDPARAVDCYVRAAGQALAANDYETVLLRASKAAEAGAHDEALGQIRLLEAEASRWRGQVKDIEHFGGAAMDLLPRGSAAWCSAVRELGGSRHRFGDLAGLEALVDALLALPPPFEAHRLVLAFRLATWLVFSGGSPRSSLLVAHAETHATADAWTDTAAGARELYLGARALFAGNLVQYLRWMLTAAGSFDRAGDARSACTPRSNAGFALIELGQFERAEEELRAVVARASRMGLSAVEASARHNLGLALARRGRFEDGLLEEKAALVVFKSGNDRRMEAACRIAMSEIELLAGRLDLALREAEEAVIVAETTPRMRVVALALVASVRLAEGHADQAILPAQEAAALLESLGSLESGEAFVRAVHAEALHATGQFAAARRVITKAREELLGRASKLEDEASRRSFLERVPDHARVLAHAAEWGEPDPAR
jgi:tetratricopeptide (TPR) repeat protein